MAEERGQQGTSCVTGAANWFSRTEIECLNPYNSGPELFYKNVLISWAITGKPGNRTPPLSWLIQSQPHKNTFSSAKRSLHKRGTDERHSLGIQPSGKPKRLKALLGPALKFPVTSPQAPVLLGSCQHCPLLARPCLKNRSGTETLGGVWALLVIHQVWDVGWNP